MTTQDLRDSTVEFKRYLVKDSRLDFKSEINYAVVQGAAYNTAANFIANSASTTSHTYQIQVPSMEVATDRVQLWNSTVVLKMVVTTPTGFTPLDIGKNDALAPFPLHQSVNTMNTTINNNNESINVQDVLPSMLRLMDKYDLQFWNSYCPVAYDTYYKYIDGVSANNNPLGSYANMNINDCLTPRGAWRILAIGTTANPADGDFSGNALNATVGPVTSTIYVKFNSTEPLLLSPWIINKHPREDQQAVYGIQNITHTMQMNNGAKMWRSARNFITSVSIQSFSADSAINVIFLTPQVTSASVMVPRNSVSYYQLPRYLTTGLAAIASGASVRYRSQTLQLNCVPDKLIVCVRKSMATQNWADTDSFMPIDSISLNFNANSGLLSNYNTQQLWAMSQKNGSNQQYQEWVGETTVYDPTGAGNGTIVPLCGSLLVVDFALDVQLPPYLSQGSLGNFNLQIDVNCTNRTGANIAANALEMCIITMNSGVLSISKGTCGSYVGILTKNDVLNTIEEAKEAYFSTADIGRMVGGAFNAKSALSGLAKGLRKVLQVTGTDDLKLGDILKKVGGGTSGGAMVGSGKPKQSKMTKHIK